ncbi:MAG: HEAT repeat domain-containing protein [Phycisphaerales bacterium]|nr:MAG: HEAT repeat domain-containing protein [Phycisphaerales bacterium]
MLMADILAVAMHLIPTRCSRALTPLLCALGAAAVLGACARDRGAPRGQGESVFELFTPPSPAIAASWATDPFDADKRLRGLLLLANAPFGGEPPYLRMYELATEDGDPGVRAVALRALAMHGTTDHAAMLIAGLTDANQLVRWEAARGLQRVHAESAIGPLIDRLSPDREESTQVRSAAARALGQYAQVRVVERLIGVLSDRSLAVNDSALASLRTLTGEDFGYDARAWFDWSRHPQTDLFAGRTPYIFPVFERDPTIVEMLLPWFGPPNEIAAQPIGMPPQESVAPAGRGG